MPVQYAWLPVMRFVPTDGGVETIDLKAAFSDTTGPGKTLASHMPEQNDRLDVNRVGRPTSFGFRPECKFTLEIISMENQAFLATIVNRLLSDSWQVYASLDNGTNYRRVKLKSYKGPEPNKEKVFTGARYELTLSGTDLLDSVPNIGTGTW